VTRSKYLIFLAAIVAALCLGVSSAIAQPMDQGPSLKPPAKANVYVPPADQFESPASPPTNPNDLSYPARASADGDSGPWLAIGLGAGGIVLLCGCAVGIQRTRRRRSVA
jgi:hypothetical protein